MSQDTQSRTFLVADVGGTNTRVALADNGALRPETIQRYRNSEYPGLETVMTTYLAAQAETRVSAAAVAVAGPVRDGRGVMTNLDWTIDTAMLTRATGASTVGVLNDLQAQGHALGHLSPGSLMTAVQGPAPAEGSASLVVGVGTGFNASPVHVGSTWRLVAPSESGHANLPVRTEADLALLRFVETAHGFPAVEDVLSGRGLERVYSWVTSEEGTPREKSAADIMAAVAAGNDPSARETVATFVRILGTVCGNLALIHLPFGGVYLVGGVSRAMAPYLKEFGFADAFRDKGRFAGFMQNFAVHVVEDDYAALTGLAAHLQNEIGVTAS